MTTPDLPADWPALRDAARARGWCLAYTLERGVIAWPLDARGFGAGPHRDIGDVAAARAWVAAGCGRRKPRMKPIKPILKYPGAKWRDAAWIIRHLPPTPHYVEPYVGSGGVFFQRKPSPHEVINDLDGRIANLFRVVRDRGDELARLIEHTPYARSEYYESYTPTGESLEDARRFLVRCWMAHGFKPYCRTGWRHNGSKSLQLLPQLWNDVPNRIRAVIGRLKQAEIESVPALALIERYRTAGTLIYADPPYVLNTRKGRKLYAHEMSDADHAALLDALDAHPGPVALSGYRCTLYDERLTHWRRAELEVQAEKGQTRTECLWLNPVLCERLSYGPLFDYVAA